ncbi:MAG: antibiotic biosynthesis monooxygenase [Flavobacteriia bacterium]|nr:antibiotic biosynthesis monooxygenase [Flavobacteriia bacterium]OJX38969.1 MAG: antibiotic biosynthesis monooxygenase [Flavobacteriia bacterium 40-80]
MITRIVKLHFQEDRIQDFLDFFETVKYKVAAFPNCHGMKLLQDIHQPNIVFTYSLWESEDDLNIYRDSELFSNVWPTIKPWFATKAEAWSVNEYFNGFPD